MLQAETSLGKTRLAAGLRFGGGAVSLGTCNGAAAAPFSTP